MNKELAIEAIAALDKLIQRALAIVCKAPYWAGIYDDKNFSHLRVLGNGTAVLSWPTAEIEWDFPNLESNEVRFPARLLFISDDELATWTAEQMREYEREQARLRLEKELQKEAAQRAEFERLKARYG